MQRSYIVTDNAGGNRMSGHKCELGQTSRDRHNTDIVQSTEQGNQIKHLHCKIDRSYLTHISLPNFLWGICKY